MKGLSIEQKAALYDEVIERAKNYLNDCPDRVDAKGCIEYLLPSLKESKDEKIKKTLIHLINEQEGFLTAINGISVKDILAWLERQGKDDMGISESTKQKLEDNLNKALEKETPKSYNEFLGEQKPTDKVEPKFKIGDFIVNDYCIGKVIKLTEDAYLLDTGQGIPFSCEHNVHRWTIQDAKEGDVIVTKNHNIFIFKEIKGTTVYDCCGLYFDKFLESPNTVNGKLDTELPKDYVPATKEQRDLLFQKMNESGYDWDAEKKELKKIEQKQSFDIEIPFGAKDSELQEVTYYIPKGFHAEIDDDKVVIKKGERPITWSEEDEKMLTSIVFSLAGFMGNEDKIDWLKSLKDRVQPQPKHKWTEEDERILEEMLKIFNIEKFEGYNIGENNENALSFLKSLKERYSWKPSDEQIHVLEKIINREDICFSGYRNEIIQSLYDDLKKLKD